MSRLERLSALRIARLLLIGCLLASPTHAESGAPEIYWTDGDDILRARSPGHVPEIVLPGLQLTVAMAVDVGGGKVYWKSALVGRILRANLGGSSVERVVGLPGTAGAGGSFDFGGMALDATHGKLYWKTRVGVFPASPEGRIQRADLGGSNVEDIVIGLDPDHDTQLALDAKRNTLCWTQSDRIRCSNLDGSNPDDFELEAAGSIAIDDVAGKVYWTLSNRIRCAGLNGMPASSSASRIQVASISIPLRARCTGERQTVSRVRSRSGRRDWMDRIPRC